MKHRRWLLIVILVVTVSSAAFQSHPVTAMRESQMSTTSNYFFSLSTSLHPQDGTWCCSTNTLIVEQDLLIAASSGDGEVYVFERDYGGTDNWGLRKNLTDSLDESLLPLGWITGAALDGDTLVIGVRSYDSKGAAFIFERDLGGLDNWGFVKTIQGSSVYSYFGQSVAISGDTIAVGAVIEFKTGGVYIFERDLGGVDNWGERTEISPTITGEFLGFGEAVALEGDTLVIAAERETVEEHQDGAVYIYERDEGGTDNWGRLGQIVGAGDTGEEFGNDLAIDGNTLVVGAPGYSTYSNAEGAIFIFERNISLPAHWEKITMLQDAEAWKNFGYSVAIDGDTVVAGNPNTMVYHSDDGMAVVYGRNEGGTGNWGTIARLTLPDGAEDDYFGRDVALSGDTLAVLAPGDDDFGDGLGAIHIFEKKPYQFVFLPLVIKQ